MPSLGKEIIDHVLANKIDKYPNFIETGTANGETTFIMEQIFEKIYTIEVFEPSYNRTKNKYFYVIRIFFLFFIFKKIFMCYAVLCVMWFFPMCYNIFPIFNILYKIYIII